MHDHIDDSVVSRWTANPQPTGCSAHSNAGWEGQGLGQQPYTGLRDVTSPPTDVGLHRGPNKCGSHGRDSAAESSRDCQGLDFCSWTCTACCEVL